MFSSIIPGTEQRGQPQSVLVIKTFLESVSLGRFMNFIFRCRFYRAIKLLFSNPAMPFPLRV
jgi:hypothetical protein